jgi:ABC-type sulfate transport system permease subunit
VLISGNLPFKTEVLSVYVFGRIESGDPGGPRPPRSPSSRSRSPSCSRSAACAASLPAMIGKYAVRFAALGYLTVLLGLPVGYVFWRTFRHGFWPAWHAVTTPDALHALEGDADPRRHRRAANTIFGILAALAIVRYRFPGAGIFNAVVDLPLALSPSSSAWRC